MTLLATCHCGATRLELPRAPDYLNDCNCTFCSRVGALWAYFAPEEVKVVSAEHRRTYAPSGLNDHYFCGQCGGNTHGESPDWASAYNPDGTPKADNAGQVPEQRIMSVNMRMVDGFDFSTVHIEKMNGRENW